VFLSCVDDDGALLSTHALQMCMLPFSDSYQDAGTVGLGDVHTPSEILSVVKDDCLLLGVSERSKSIDTNLGRAMVVSRDQ
jgi:hypothetical protein